MNDIDLKPIVINPQALVLAKDKAGNFALSAEAGKEIEKILYVKNLIEDIYEYAQQVLTAEMKQANIQKITDGKVSVVRRYYGERFEIKDKDSVDDRFKKEVVYVKPDSLVIEKYLEETGELPKGVSHKDRQETASITMKEEE